MLTSHDGSNTKFNNQADAVKNSRLN